MIIIWNVFEKSRSEVLRIVGEKRVAIVGTDSWARAKAERGESNVFGACQEGIGSLDGLKRKDGTKKRVVFEWNKKL